jgi:capsular exopolysaccharide synthesis family protein
MQAEIVELRRQAADFAPVYTENYGKLKRVQSQLAAVQAVFDAKRSEIVTRIKNDYSEALRKEGLLAAAYAAQTKVVTADGEKSIQYNILKREADSNRQMYDTMLQQLKESTIASALRASNLRIVDAAMIPRLPYKPRVSVSTVLGMIFGALVGVTFIVVRARADRTIQSPGETVLYLKLPELGIIPAIKAPRINSKLPIKDRVELVTWQHKPSAIAESFRSTLISMLFANHNGPTAKTFVLTSAQPSEGKSTVASNLAIAIAEVGQRVLLIDADMRRPRLHDIFGMANETGLTDALRDRATLNGDFTLGGVIQQTSVPNLYLLPSGKSVSSATNLLYGPRTAELLEYLKSQFDSVLIDTPPMLGIPDARVLGRMADSVILVVRAGHTTRDSAAAALQRFSDDGTKIMGTILNNWNPKATGHYYGYGRDYYYSSSSYYHEK